MAAIFSATDIFLGASSVVELSVVVEIEVIVVDGVLVLALGDGFGEACVVDDPLDAFMSATFSATVSFLGSSSWLATVVTGGVLEVSNLVAGIGDVVEVVVQVVPGGVTVTGTFLISSFLTAVTSLEELAAAALFIAAIRSAMDICESRFSVSSSVSPAGGVLVVVVVAVAAPPELVETLSAFMSVPVSFDGSVVEGGRFFFSVEESGGFGVEPVVEAPAALFAFIRAIRSAIVRDFLLSGGGL